MAAGATHVSAKFVSNMSLASLASLWATNTIKMGIITNTSPPAVADSDPRWGAGGAQNYSTNEVTPGGNYAAGGITLTSPTSTLSGTVTSLNCTSPISLAANASNPTGAYWGVFYDSTDAGKHVFGYIDLGGPLSLVAGLQINVNGVSSGTQPVLQGTAT
jgi:flagellar capping protein FliD